MRNLTWIPAAAVLAVGWLAILTKPASANPDWTKKERKQCVYCHIGAWDSGKYTEAGQYYKDHEYSFKGYVPKPASDGKGQTSTSPTGKKPDSSKN
jgi:hypothetical protein